MLPHLLLGLLLPASAASCQEPAPPPAQAATPDAYVLALPPGPAARAWAGVGPETAPAPLDPGLLAALAGSGQGTWDGPGPWQRWAAALEGLVAAQERAARPGAPRDPAAAGLAAELCLLAASQGRGADAWAHFAALTDDPAQAARCAAHLIPGVPLGSELGLGGQPLGLPDGAVLRPLLPEYPADDPARDLAWREASVSGLAVGRSRVDLTLAVESTGVSLDLALRSGPSVELSARLPQPADFAIRFEYVDWSRVDPARVPHRVRLVPGEDEPHTLYGRVAPAPVPWPTPRPGHLTAATAGEGLWLVLPAEDPQAETWEACAAALGRLLGVPAGTRPPVGPDRVRPGLELVLPPAEREPEAPDSRAAFARYLASALEAHLLRAP